MANPEHLDMIMRGVNAWNEWRIQNPGIRPDLANIKLQEPSSGTLSQINLSEANLTGAALRYLNIHSANLQNIKAYGADFRSSNFRGANFSDADLTRSGLNGGILDRAILRNANLNHAYLYQVNCAGADFTGAKLTSADLRQVTFHSTTLTDVDFTDASIGETLFADVDLSSVLGLETVQHVGPSTIGIDTIYRSNGRIPRVFLVGAGVPDRLIEYAESLIGQPIQFYSCFISYSHCDKAFARRLHDALQARGIRCWLDEKQLLPGQDIYDEVDSGIRHWDKLLLCCSQHSLKSWWVDNEIGKAFAKEQQITKERGRKALALIPLNLDGYLFSWQDGKADEIRRRYAPDFTAWATDPKTFDAQINRLVKALHADDAAREKPPTPLL